MPAVKISDVPAVKNELQQNLPVTVINSTEDVSKRYNSDHRVEFNSNSQYSGKEYVLVFPKCRTTMLIKHKNSQSEMPNMSLYINISNPIKGWKHKLLSHAPVPHTNKHQTRIQSHRESRDKYFL